MNSEIKFIKDVDNLVPRPDIALAVMSLAHAQDFDIKELSAKIEQDPSLTANMLRIANSAYFGHMKKINSITDIIIRLGIDTVKMLAITGASVGFLKTPQDAYNLKPGSLWTHSYATAILASIIGNYARTSNISIVYSAALLHDIGKILLNKELQLQCSNRNMYWDGNDISNFEESMVGTNHTRVAVALLKKWGLPDTIIRPVYFHHNPKVLDSDDMNSKIVYLANSLVENIGISAVEADECIVTLKKSNLDAELKSVPGLEENIEDIIEEFFEKFTN